MSVIGTAGHVDHGKSTLLQALTGRDPDRWEEEKRRGLTIDLGFVWTTLPSGEEVSFVDVPGHERFIKNMLAGIEAIDVALLVVAADEGWMPQSEEHLAVLDLLEVNRAVVALTKIDRVDPDVIELAALEVAEQLTNTSLEGTPIVAVSALTGDGLDELAHQLDALLPPPPPETDPRLWVDRRFSIPGAGTVVTGTLLGGPITIGDTLAQFPGGSKGRVRGIESHERALDRVAPHRRVALNLVGAEERLGRGWMLGRDGNWDLSSRFTAAIRPARYVSEIGDRGAYQVHIGTAAIPARLRRVGEGWLVGLATALPLRYGDRFILRETGRRLVVGGGSVLDPAPPRRQRSLAAAAALPSSLGPIGAADALLALRGREALSRLRAHSGAEPAAGIRVGDMLLTEDEFADLRRAVREEVARFHSENPLREGIPLATLATRLGVDAAFVDALVASAEEIVAAGAVVKEVGRSQALTPEQERSWTQARLVLAEAGLTPPRVGELGLDPELLHRLLRQGELVRVSADLVYLPSTAEEIRRLILAMGDDFTVADFRDAAGISRKYAVPILEWADGEGLTRRRGDLRSPRR